MSFLRTPACLELIEEALCKECGDMKSACKSINVSPRDVYQWCAVDTEVAGRIRAAQQMGWAGLESEAYRRGVEGVEVPVYQKGECVGYKTEYSDSLLALMMKARIPEYGTEKGAGTSVSVNVAILPRADTYEEWTKQRDIELRKQPEARDLTKQPEARDLTKQPEPVALPNYTEADFVEVSDEAKAAYVLMKEPVLKDVL